MINHIHQQDDNNQHVVGISDLRVMLVEDDGSWFAQGMDIDYAAQGSTIEEAQENFARGLQLTVRAHLISYGGIDRLLGDPAPKEIWREFQTAVVARKMRYSFVASFDLSEVADDLDKRGLAFPYERIAFMQARKAA